jgi:hypothetical protein
LTQYRPPRDCPVCQHRLHLTQLGCPHCGSGLSGDFEPCQFCGLDDAQLDILRVFLASRGNMKELERHLGVSYPTVRARFDELLGALGLADGPAPPPGFEAPPPDDDVDRGAVDDDPRRATLEALARGDIDVAGARASLTAPPPPPAAAPPTPPAPPAPADPTGAAKPTKPRARRPSPR